jgi:hypothetical protein
VWGSSGKLTTDRTFTAGPAVRPVVELQTESAVERVELPADNHFANLLREFVRLIRKDDFAAEYSAILRQAALQEEFRELAIKA